MATPIAPYTPPSLCIGNWTIQNDCTTGSDSKTIENQVAESLEIAGAPIAIFKLLGVHEQGKLIDLTGQGSPLSNGTGAGSDVTNAFDISSSSWKSAQTGTDVVVAPAYLGYNFGTKKTATGTERYAPSANIIQHITTIRIQQGALPQNRALQIRVDRATGQVFPNVSFAGTGNGQLTHSLQPVYAPKESTTLITSTSPTTFSVISSLEGPLGTATLGQPFASQSVRFTILAGAIPFVVGDTFTIKLLLDWKRVDVVNLPDTSNLETISIQTSSPSTFWRIVPLLFSGGLGDAWEITKLEMIDYQSTSINNIQDTLFLENRDRDYSQSSITLKCQYQPFDSVGDLGKFGFSILDQYIFTCSFARMVELLGRPIVVGDILEITPELQYDQNLNPVKKFLEVTDCGWSAEGYTPQWKPILYRFQAIQLLPSVEVRDIIKMPEEELFTVSDGTFFDKLSSQTQTTPTLVSETIAAEAADKVPERGEDLQDVAVVPELPDANIVQNSMFIENGLPPNGLPYGEGYKLPDTATLTPGNDGDYFRLNYASNMNIPPRLYKFSALKGRWIYVETDMRDSYSSHKPSVRNALVSLNKKSLQDTNL